jgi:hypothetical protein
MIPFNLHRRLHQLPQAAEAALRSARKLPIRAELHPAILNLTPGQQLPQV